MKKIKFLLLWIVSIIWLGFSFALDEPFVVKSSTWSISVTFPVGDSSWGSDWDCFYFPRLTWANTNLWPNISVSLDNWVTFFSWVNFFCWPFIVHNSYNSSLSADSYIFGLSGFIRKNSYMSFFQPATATYWDSVTNSLSPGAEGLLNFPNYEFWDCYAFQGWDISQSYYLNLYLSYTWKVNQISNISSTPNYIICGSWVYAKNTNTRYSFSLRGTRLVDFWIPDPEPDEPVDITTPLIPVDWSPFDIMWLYIRQYVLCKMTSWHLYPWAVGSCDWFQWEEFFEWHSTMIDDDENRIRMSIYSGYWFLSNYCASVSNNFLVPFCSQLDLYEDSQVDYFLFKDTWDLRMYILWSWFNLELSFSSGGLLSSQCFGVWCPDYVKTWDFQYIPDTWNNNSNSFTWYLVDQSFYNVNNWNRLFFNCPYPYSWSYLVIAQNLIDNLWWVDILKPINCFISAFSYWDKTLYFGDPESNTFYWSWSLINWDSYSHKLLFSFFDLILSIWIFVLLRKLFKF